VFHSSHGRRRRRPLHRGRMNVTYALAFFSAHAYGKKKAWQYEFAQINMEEWARGIKRVR
jgi:hypothetical protein